MTVYFIRRKGDPSGLIKIGLTSDLSRRLASMETTIPEGIDLLVAIDGGEPVEAHFHALFRDSRVSGEWFVPSADLLACIDGLKLRALDAGDDGLRVASREETAPTDRDRAIMEEMASAIRLLGSGAATAIEGNLIAASKTGLSLRIVERLRYGKIPNVTTSVSDAVREAVAREDQSQREAMRHELDLLKAAVARLEGQK